MAIELDTSGPQTIIHIQGRFVFADVYRDFRLAYESHQFVDASVRKVNMSGVDFIDSSGLAMLLEMREFLGGENANINLVGPNYQIKHILDVSGFIKLFSMD